jgi:hypothetical protein
MTVPKAADDGRWSFTCGEASFRFAPQFGP